MSMENRSSVRVEVGRPPSGEPGAEGKAAEELIQPRVYQTPPIDIHEGPEGLVLEADLPGASEDNLVVQLEENVLSLHVHVPAPVPEGSRVLHEEYHVADFYRSFILSDEVDRSKISAELRNGVLRLMLPKAERARTRRIEIKST